ncbi:ABC transporter permease [Actinospica sp. MGRD01-02]|uniref:ABC transporter permease n=1 Tax=Actinospica acidithermotolerans TaxID=2828514 RepID=A0A941EC80_9ACTN|nr:ABC transporter permease [Actinospica acidithermotolerans]MBR7827778.1 ABC transporter permease [Actinospica acidithermotolerans]
MTTLTQTPAPTRERGLSPIARLAGLQRRLPLLQIVILVALVLYVGNADGDYSWNDLLAPILLQASFLGIAAAGQTLVILVGGLDFSIAAYIVAGNLLVTHLVGNEHWNFGAVALLVAAICVAGGGFSGWLCHRFKLEPLVITLAMSSIVVGVLVGSNTGLLNGSGPGWLQSFTNQTSDTFGLPIPPIVAFWILLAAAITVVLLKTPLGRRLYLAGAGPKSADLAGVSTRRVWTAAYAASALLAGLAGVLLAGFSTGGDTNVGNSYLFPGLAAVIVGGTMMGGRGDYLRTCLGALIVTTLNFVISVNNLSASAANVVFGALILLVVALYGRERRLRDRV